MNSKPKKRDNKAPSLVEFFQSAPDGHALDLERKRDATRTLAELEQLWHDTPGDSGGERWTRDEIHERSR